MFYLLILPSPFHSDFGISHRLLMATVNLIVRNSDNAMAQIYFLSRVSHIKSAGFYNGLKLILPKWELELGVYRHIHICAAYATRVVTSELLWMYHMKIIFLIIAANQEIGWDFILGHNQWEERLALE